MQPLKKTAAWIENVIINSKWMHEVTAGQKKKPRYLEETPWFPEYYIGWIEIGNSGQKTSTTQLLAVVIAHTIILPPTGPFKFFLSEKKWQWFSKYVGNYLKLFSKEQAKPKIFRFIA